MTDTRDEIRAIRRARNRETILDAVALVFLLAVLYAGWWIA